MKNVDTLGDLCKWYEINFSPDLMIPTLPVIIRLDGNNFSQWTKGLNKPFDDGMSTLMIETAKHLVKETNAVISFVASDEITLILYSSDRKSKIFNDGKKQKILSKLTGICVNFFNENRKKYLPNHIKTANFDCRIYQVPSLDDACLQLLWRENDTVRNSKYLLANSLFSHKELQNLNGSELQDKMMLEKNVNWNDLEVKFKRGTYVRRIKTTKKYTPEELALLPKNHNAHKNLDLVIERHIIAEIDMPIFGKVVNKSDVVFFGADPKYVN